MAGRQTGKTRGEKTGSFQGSGGQNKEGGKVAVLEDEERLGGWWRGFFSANELDFISQAIKRGLASVPTALKPRPERAAPERKHTRTE